MSIILRKIRELPIAETVSLMSEKVESQVKTLSTKYNSVVQGINREIVPIMQEVTAELNRLGGNVLSLTAAREVLNTDRFLFADDSSGYDVTLPEAAFFKNQPLTVKKKGNSAVTTRIVAQSTETIDGASSVTLHETYGAIQVFSDGVDWHILSGGNGASGKVLNTTRVTTTYTILATDEVIFCDTDGGAFTVTLPAGVVGATYRIINVGSSGNDVTLATTGSDTVNGAASERIADAEHFELTYESTEGWW